MKTCAMGLIVVGVFVAVVRVDWTKSTPPAQQAAARAGAVARELTLDLGDKVILTLVEIPAGKFLMGSPMAEKGRQDDEVQHEVTISKPFCMGETHVTVDQFAAFARDSGYKTDAEKSGWSPALSISGGILDANKTDGCSWRSPSFDQKGDHPVVQVSWNDAMAFCDWLSRKSGKTISLPTEAQWEYACRAGTETTYPWGDNPDDGAGFANCADQSLKRRVPNSPAVIGFFNWDDGFVFTSPVGSFKANPFGIFDMVGNANQWCQERYGDYDAGATIDPAGAKTGSLRVLRGGSWFDGPAGGCRSACRDGSDPDFRCGYNGFRVTAVAD